MSDPAPLFCPHRHEPCEDAGCHDRGCKRDRAILMGETPPRIPSGRWDVGMVHAAEGEMV